MDKLKDIYQLIKFQNELLGAKKDATKKAPYEKQALCIYAD
jgi:hypothetical protein